MLSFFFTLFILTVTFNSFLQDKELFIYFKKNNLLKCWQIYFTSCFCSHSVFWLNKSLKDVQFSFCLTPQQAMTKLVFWNQKEDGCRSCPPFNTQSPFESTKGQLLCCQWVFGCLQSICSDYEWLSALCIWDSGLIVVIPLFPGARCGIATVAGSVS